MKIRKLILLAILSLVALFSCKKDTDPNIATFKIVKETEKVLVGTTEATISGTYEYPGKINSIKVRIGTDEQLFGSDLYATEVSGKAYSVHVTDLRSGTAYYYRYEVDYGAKEDFLSEISGFTTQSESPTVKTLEVLALDSTTFRIKCEVLSGGGQEVTERGICWNTYGDPTLDDETMQYVSGGIGQYTIRMENLATNTAYYVRAYAKSAAGIGFGEELNFRTGGSTTTPRVSTVEISNITYNAAQCLGNISSDGGLSITERGVCWGLEPNPTVNVHKVPAEGTEIGNYTVTIDGLNLNTDYHVRAYAINEKGIAYGEDLPFKTTEGKPTVTTSGITEITSTSAKGGGEVTDQGASVVTERGICWSTSHEPMASGNHATNGTGAGSYICNMTNLTPNETYYVRAYATNTQGTAYGAEVEFTAKEGLPSVLTLGVTDITATAAKGHGKVTDQGGSQVTERGICWGTEPSPTIDGNHAYSGTGVGEFEISMTNLSPGTTYYVRAYAKNSQGLTYGEQKDFKTEATLPTVTTGNINGTTVSGNVANDGGATVTERGICWSATNNEPTVANTHASNGTGTGSYTVELTDLKPGTTYHVRAYATNEKGTAYGEVKILTTEANQPTVTTGEVTNIGQNSAQGSGNVTDDGGAEVTERGVCWSTSHNPTISGSHANSGTGIGGFIVSMTSLTANTHYYVRAYAKNSAGIGYGNEVDFTTSQNISAPTVTTAQVTDIHQTTAIGGGNVTSDGGSSVTERGICWGTNHNPTTSGSHASNGTGTGNYTVNMTGLTPGTTYYVRAYAINDADLIGYGSEVSFNTQQQQPTTYTISVSANPSNGGTAHVGSPTGPTTGTYNSGQSCSLYATANSNYTFANWTENGSVVSTNASYQFTVNGNRTLMANFIPIVVPTVTTKDVTNIQQTTAIGGGNVTSNGGATVTARGVCWSTNSNPTISNSYTTDGTGTGNFTSSITGLTPGTLYHVRAYATNSKGTAYGLDVTFTTTGGTGGHAYVDLGLPSGLLWATCNVGADNPEDYGDYFAWGETQPKDTYDWSTYQYCMGSDNTLTKYCNNSSYGYNGFTDNLTILGLGDDAASANWSSGWRMPTMEDWQELYQNTTKTWTTQNGVYGRLFTANNGNSLFLPAAGYRGGSGLYLAGTNGCFWSSSLYTSRPYSAWYFDINSGHYHMDIDYRYYGRSIRPVRSSGQN